MFILQDMSNGKRMLFSTLAEVSYYVEHTYALVEFRLSTVDNENTFLYFTQTHNCDNYCSHKDVD